jgi:hypothetical protein
MAESASSLLAPWSSYYILTGSAAGALIGLMFVVITLVTGSERLRKAPDGISTFSTPTVVHFGAALFVSAMLSAPWRSLLGPAILLGLAALCGVVYVARLAALTKRLDSYDADLEDWIWYTILPFIAYGAILAGAITLAKFPVDAMFALAAGVATLIFIGIHNAWDIVTYIVIGGPDEPPPSAN